MVHYMIICRSLTYAQRTARAMENAGITAIVMRSPTEISGSDCSYCVKISEKNLALALMVMKRAGLDPGRIYLKRSDGSSDEVIT